MAALCTPSLDQLADIFVLESVKGFGPQKFKDLHKDQISVAGVLERPREMQRFGKRGLDFQKQIEALNSKDLQQARERAKRQLEGARSTGGAILTYNDPNYPPHLFSSNMPVPVLYARGDFTVLSHGKAVACVGSRKIRTPYAELHSAFARMAVGFGYAIVSGFATGADIIGHLAAESAHARTICVMPSGLDRPFPPEHKGIWDRFIDTRGVVFVSEFGFGMGANSLNLRKRNKTLVGLADGVLVSQSTENGGAMNAYRFAMEQKKPIATFRSDGSCDTSGNDLIAGSAKHVKMTVLELVEDSGWTKWLQAL